MKTPLHQGWTVRALAGPVPDAISGRLIPATVPGCVTTDLLAAGLVPDPYLDENEGRLAWIGRTDWRFETHFDAAQTSGRCDLVCEGLDSVATVELNGVVLGRTANMHRTYRFDTRPALRSGRNDLQVTFAAPVTWAEQMSQELGPRPYVNAHPFNAIRKMACNFGWDWGPDLPTSGIWRPISLERWNVARIASVRPLIGVDAGALARQADPRRADATVTVHVEVERDGGDARALAITASVGAWQARGVTVPGATISTLEVRVPEAELWWPAGYGSQTLYGLQVDLTDGEPAAVLDHWQGRIGFRTVALDTTADEIGTNLALVVNGRTISVRGANWIPDDCFVNRVTRQRYRQRVADAREANMNLLRVWGGGIYESEDFYDAADEMGLLVWQDFLFACAAYAEEEPLRQEVIAEARQAVTRLCPHPSLAVWNGCNENLWAHEDWGWKQPLGGRSWGAGYYFAILPGIVSDLDPTRPYTPGSPWSFRDGVHPNDPSNGSMHVWDVWNDKDYTAYADYSPRFVAEFGFQGPPAWSTLTRAVHDDPLVPGSPALRAHQKAADGMAKLDRGLAPHLPGPTSMADWHWATSLNQARAVAFGIERWRSLTPRCNGMIVWQLNDCWPVISWAAVDGDGRRKPLWYALRRSYADRLLTIQPTGAGLALVAVNDSTSPWHATLAVNRQDFHGTVHASGSATIDAPPGASATWPLDPGLTTPRDGSAEVLVVADKSTRALWFYADDKDLALPVPDLEAKVERVAGGYTITVTAATLQRDVALLADKVAPAAVSDDMLITLLAGETVTFHVRTDQDLDADALAQWDVLRSANQLLHPVATAVQASAESKQKGRTVGIVAPDPGSCLR